ncbi:MAG TPA: type IV toxin-antitoxin system AbiEi family antitoxin domain-containing protein [Solirubrobacteraceae bacterium]|jgi:hypothetical protein|nr:type IV toxin-antitoxin system AbiEi family antitoxin domain-containing protein [Solirubrobacteraceae bacterium]
MAGEQHGQVSTHQLRACGLDSKAIARRVRDGRLHRVHRGVYAVGHAGLTREGRFVAAVLACGDGAALSHVAAAALWGMLPWDERHPEVTVAGTGTRRIAGIRVHRARALHERDVVRRLGIRVTSPARTLLDLAAILPPRVLRAAARRAQAEKRVSVRQLVEVVQRSNGHHGAGALMTIATDGPAPTRSVLEDLLLDLLDGAGIPRPEINPSLRLDGRAVIPDFLWPREGLVVEADGAAWHDDRLSRRDDADRQASLEAHGYRVVRVTWRQIVDHPQQTLARIRAALRADQRQSA